MSDSFQIEGSFSLVVDMEIEKPAGWQHMEETVKRDYISRQLQEKLDTRNDYVSPDDAIVDEVLESAEEIFNE